MFLQDATETFKFLAAGKCISCLLISDERNRSILYVICNNEIDFWNNLEKKTSFPI